VGIVLTAVFGLRMGKAISEADWKRSAAVALIKPMTELGFGGAVVVRQFGVADSAAEAEMLHESGVLRAAVRMDGGRGGEARFAEVVEFGAVKLCRIVRTELLHRAATKVGRYAQRGIYAAAASNAVVGVERTMVGGPAVGKRRGWFSNRNKRGYGSNSKYY